MFSAESTWVMGVFSGEVAAAAMLVCLREGFKMPWLLLPLERDSRGWKEESFSGRLVCLPDGFLSFLAEGETSAKRLSSMGLDGLAAEVSRLEERSLVPTSWSRFWPLPKPEG